MLYFYIQLLQRVCITTGRSIFREFSGKCTAIPHLLIYIFVLRNYVHTGLRGLGQLSGLDLVNIVFIFNSHIAGRSRYQSHYYYALIIYSNAAYEVLQS